MNYDSMSAEDLFEAFGHLHSDGVLDAEYPFQRYGGTWAKKCYELEAIIRRAVIREDVVHCGECVYAAWESQEPCGKGEGIACHVVAGRSRPWLGAVTDYCSEGKKAKS